VRVEALKGCVIVVASEIGPQATVRLVCSGINLVKLLIMNVLDRLRDGCPIL